MNLARPKPACEQCTHAGSRIADEADFRQVCVVDGHRLPTTSVERAAFQINSVNCTILHVGHKINGTGKCMCAIGTWEAGGRSVQGM